MKVFMILKGFVRVKLWGNGVERFFGLCAHKNIYLWEMQVQNKYIYVNMRLNDFYQCKKLARKAGVRAVVVERHGLPFFIPKIFKRSFFIVGIFFFFLCVFISSNMLLHININGNYSITDDVFMEFLKEQHINYGMWLKNIPLEELEKKIRNEFDVITWASGKIDGTALVIDLKENEKPEVIKERSDCTYGSSLYANMDGIVRTIFVRKGIPAVKKDMEVKKGDLLVDGLVPIYNQSQLVSSYQFYDADADIFLETMLPVNLVLESSYMVKEYTGRSAKGSYISLNGKIYRNTLKDKKYNYKDVLLQPQNVLQIGKFPVAFGSFESREYVIIEKAHTKSQAEELLLKEFDKNNEILLEKGVQIIEKDVTIDIIMGKWTLKGNMRVIMPAYERKPNEIPEVLNDSEGI